MIVRFLDTVDLEIFVERNFHMINFHVKKFHRNDPYRTSVNSAC